MGGRGVFPLVRIYAIHMAATATKPSSSTGIWGSLGSEESQSQCPGCNVTSLPLPPDQLICVLLLLAERIGGNFISTICLMLSLDRSP